MTRACLVALCLALGQAAAGFPEAMISSGSVKATFSLPDAQTGYYRGTRFDWSGVVSSLTWNGHEYFGQWFERYDPKLHDAITGPVEEFLSNGAGLGYDEAKPGETFVRIGVGSVRKPDEPKYRQFSTYDIVDPGMWTVHRGSNWIEFTHQLGDSGGYAYVYTKKMQLSGNTLTLAHSLKNAGRKPISTSVYEHNFFMLDGQPTGPDVVVRFPFEPRAVAPLEGLAETKGHYIVFLKELQRRETVQTDLEGFRATAGDYDIRVENTKTGAGVRQTGDRPMSKLHLWSIRTTVCPEAFVDLQVEPGKTVTWRIAYEFYQVSHDTKKPGEK